MAVVSPAELQNIISPKFTEDTLYNIVSNYKKLSQVKIDNIEIGDPSKKGDSYLSHICRFKLTANGTNEDGCSEVVSIPVIAKYFPTNLGRRKTFRSADFFENEVIFYEKVWPAFQKFQKSKNISTAFDNIPLILASHVDGTNDFVALLDISPQGYISAVRGPGLDKTHTIAILKLLAQFHAVSLAFKDQDPEKFNSAASSLKETYFSDRLRPWYFGFFQNVIGVYKDAVKKELPDEYFNRFEEYMKADVHALLCKACQDRGPLSVVTHGDVWVPNFLIKYKDNQLGDITMIDFQLTRYTSLATDLMFFIFSCADAKLLENDFDELVKEYHQALVQGFTGLGSRSDLVSLDDIYNDIKKFIGFGVGMSMEALIMSLLDDDEISDLDSIQGTEAVPLESVWIIHPFKEQQKRERIAALFKFVIDRKYI